MNDPFDARPAIETELSDAYFSVEKIAGTGAAAVVKERLRQVKLEGYEPGGDLRYRDSELLRAAAAYLLAARQGSDEFSRRHGLTLWPVSWAAEMFKPKNRRRDLVRAAALIIAEIDRLDREEFNRAAGDAA